MPLSLTRINNKHPLPVILTLFVMLGVSIGLTGCFPNDKGTNNVNHNDNVTDNVKNNTVQTKSTTKNIPPSNQMDASNPSIATNTPTVGCNNRAIFQAYQQKKQHRKIQTIGCGQIIKVLKDDNDGSRHQKLLVRIDDYPQITVLIAHNIDLAPRVANVQAHTPIQFYGEYIYNDKGGVVHWTHKDPASRHQDGWLLYQGQKYW
ncbi:MULTISPECIES: DUF3465 domain-containing protein [unclassified Moraxella]|uniref:DUF3465 domain-containing protein n=1 Tax=unclassified Moraxella TaxID=2685852 RepID=UPI003AF62D2B